MSHDPQLELEKLRNQLAASDAPLAFLLGAGTSASIRVTENGEDRSLVPTVLELTAACRAEVGRLGAAYANAFDGVARDTRPCVSRIQHRRHPHRDRSAG